MSDSANKAVFLSYASQDAEAARRICDALRSAGVEVWFDQSELRGGDAWDAKIRKQIKECGLFVPIISTNTEARGEGYFRLEWKLAVDRSHLMARDETFLVPVVVDDTTAPRARVPEEFHAVQWTRLTSSEKAEGFAARVKTLADPGAMDLPASESQRHREVARIAAPPASSTDRWSGGAIPRLAALLLLAVVGGAWWWMATRPPATVVAQTHSAPEATDLETPIKRPPLKVLVGEFSNRTGDPRHAATGELLSEQLKARLAGESFIKIAATAPPRGIAASTEPDTTELADIGDKTKGDLLVQGVIFSQGDKLQFIARIYDLATRTRFAALEPVTSASTDATAAIEECIQRLATATWCNHISRDPLVGSASRRMKLACPPRWDAFRVLQPAINAFYSAETALQAQKAYDMDPRGNAGALAHEAWILANLGRYEDSLAVAGELNSRRDDLSEFDGVTLDAARAISTGNLPGLVAAARKGLEIVPGGLRWQRVSIRALEASYRPREMIDCLDRWRKLSGKSDDWTLWGYRQSAHVLLGDYAAALAVARESHESGKWTAEAFALGLSGRTTELETLWRTSLQARRETEINPGMVAARGLRALPSTVPVDAFAAFAREALQKADAFGPQSRTPMAKAWILYALGEWPALEAHLAELSDSRLGEIGRKGWLGEVAARMGRTDEARNVIRWLRAQDPKQQFGYAELMEARILAVLGDKKAAIDRLSTAMQRWVASWDEFTPVSVLYDRAFDSLRDDPEFKKLIAPQG